jgi:hypothetical protein
MAAYQISNTSAATSLARGTEQDVPYFTMFLDMTRLHILTQEFLSFPLVTTRDEQTAAS